MLKDRLLLRKLRHGQREALRAIYEKYERFLLTIAANLLDDKTVAEDVVQDVFVSFARSMGKVGRLRNLRGYLTRSVTNRARDHLRRKVRRRTANLETADHLAVNADSPVQMVIRSEEMEKLSRAILEVPYDQREAIVLRLHGGLKFREIAELQDVSVQTVLSRYRYGLDKLRSLLNGAIRT